VGWHCKTLASYSGDLNFKHWAGQASMTDFFEVSIPSSWMMKLRDTVSLGPALRINLAPLYRRIKQSGRGSTWHEATIFNMLFTNCPCWTLVSQVWATEARLVSVSCALFWVDMQRVLLRMERMCLKKGDRKEQKWISVAVDSYSGMYRVVKKSLCTWWLQYKKHAKIF
jgi:hypothetical protein